MSKPEEEKTWDRDRQLMQSAIPAVRNCFAASLHAGTKTNGTISVWIELTPEGQVYAARIKDSTWPDAAGSRCTLETMRQLRFDPPVKGTITLTYPLHLTTEGD